MWAKQRQVWGWGEGMEEGSGQREPCYHKFQEKAFKPKSELIRFTLERDSSPGMVSGLQGPMLES